MDFEKKPAIQSEERRKEKLINETRQQGARRRLIECDENSYGEMISKIKDETLPELSATFKEKLATIAGSGLPLIGELVKQINVKRIQVYARCIISLKP